MNKLLEIFGFDSSKKEAGEYSGYSPIFGQKARADYDCGMLPLKRHLALSPP